MSDFASPDDMKRAPLWHNYVMAQMSRASVGRIPRSTWRIGVRIDRERLTLDMDWTDPDAVDLQDWADLVSEFEELVGPDVVVDAESHVTEVGQAPHRDGVDHTYISREVYDYGQARLVVCSAEPDYPDVGEHFARSADVVGVDTARSRSGTVLSGGQGV